MLAQLARHRRFCDRFFSGTLPKRLERKLNWHVGTCDMTIFDEVMGLEISARRVSLDDAKALDRRIRGEAPETILEICQDMGQPSLLLAAILKEQGRGSLTTFLAEQSASSEALDSVIAQLGYREHLTALPAGRSVAWALQRLISAGDRPKFDVCLIDGNKTWESVGFNLVLADMLLRRGGLLVLMNTAWTMAGSPYFRERPHLTEKFDKDQLETAPVQRAVDLLLPHLGYEVVATPETKIIAFARKT